MGQAKRKQIVCPVTGRVLTPVECGTRRISDYACPESCPRNPWSVERHDQALDIYDRMMAEAMPRMRDEWQRVNRWPPNPSDPVEAAILLVNHFFRERDERNTTFFERWQADGFRGLNNDETVLLKALSRVTPALIEIHQVVDDRRLIARDLLDPDGEAMLMVDQSLASRACRFTTLLTLIYKTPYGWRTHGVGIEIPEVPGRDEREVLLALIKHHGGPTDDLPTLRNGLLDRFERVAKGLSALSMARMEAMFRNMDAALTQSVYRLHGRAADVAHAVELRPDFAPDPLTEQDRTIGFTHRWVWTRRDDAHFAGDSILGNLLLHPDGHVRLDTFSNEGRDKARGLLEAWFGDTLSFAGERTDDVALQSIERMKPSYDATLFPAELLDRPSRVTTSQSRSDLSLEEGSSEEILRRVRIALLKAWIDAPSPALDDRSPREASAIPELRPHLLRMAKAVVRSSDRSDLEQGIQTDVNGMLEELGLHEIAFPPPPLRAPPIEEDPFDEDDEWMDEALDWDFDPLDDLDGPPR